MTQQNWDKAEIIRKGVLGYLAKYNGDKTWHPLFVATRDLYAYMVDGY